MVTAESNTEIVAEAIESEIDCYILKPLNIKSLGDRIMGLIEKVNNPSPMILHLKRSRDLEESHNLVDAIHEAKIAAKADLKSSKPVYKLGQLYHKKKDLKTAEKCFLKATQMNPLDVREELESLVSRSGLDGEVELYLHRPGYEAKNVDQLLKDLGRAHEQIHGDQMVYPPDPAITSMWRDTNVYAEFGIPAVTYGPGGGGGSSSLPVPVEDLPISLEEASK